MIEIIIFILPTFFSIIMHDILNKVDKNAYSIMKTFGGYCCLNNLLVMLVLFIYKNGEFNINENIQRFDFIFKYFILASVMGIIVPIIIKFIKKNVELEFIFKEKIENEKEI